MEIKLDRLTLEHFKGVAEFTLGVNGMSAQVHGQNGAGKTTLMDGFLWLLFGKDSSGKADFAVKTLDTHGQELHNLCHSVEAVLSVDGKPLTLKKSLAEKWVKRRGSAKATFTGHSTDLTIDGVPVKESDWKARIASIIQEDTFRLLTDPMQFNRLHWQRRREILLQVCGDVSDRDVIASDRDLRDLPEILGDRTLEDHRKVVAAKKKEINDRLREIPARIDELTRGLVDVSAYDPSAIHARILTLDHTIQEAKSDPGNATLRKQRATLEADLATVQGKLTRMQREAETTLDRKIADLTTTHFEKQSALRQAKNESMRLTDVILRNEREMDRLRVQFSEVAAEQYSGPETCPACGQALPEGQVKLAWERHNAEQSRKLEEIQAAGRKLKAANEENAQEKARFESTRTLLEGEITVLEAKIQTAQKEKPVTLAAVGKLEKESVEGLKAQIDTLSEKIVLFLAPDTTAMEQERAGEQRKLAEIEASAKTRARIEELSKEEKILAAEYERLERETFILEKFTVAKVHLLEDRVSGKFQLARFKLFTEQVNGGIAETCVTLYEGVPFGSGLNTGSEINVGLDIIRTLSQHYGIKAPVWIDHKESVTETLDPETQTIMLVVDPDCPTLEVRQ